MKKVSGWTRLEFGRLATQNAVRPSGKNSLRCIELEHVESKTGKLLGEREGTTSETSKITFCRGEVLFGKLRPYLTKAWEATFDGICSSEFWVLHPQKLICDTAWLKQLLLSELFSRATFASSGSKMPRADWSVVSEHPFNVPPLHEQRKIADILTTWDGALNQLDALIEAQERRKKALMQRLLTGRRRLPGFKGKWKHTRLGAVLEPIIRPVAKPQGAFLSAGIRSHGKGVFLKPEFKPADIALEELFQLKAGDLVVNITFAWEGAVAIVPPEADGALVSHRFPTFGFREGQAATSFFRHYIRTKRFVFNCGLASPGGAGRNRVLSKTAFLDIGLSLPDMEEQEKIGTILNTVDQQLTLLRMQRAAIAQQKRGLMQRLLTGRIRVKP